jgi:transcriptional regulator with XRE-family HTH domain
MITEKTRYHLIKNQALPYLFGAKVLPDMPETLGELISRRMIDLGIPSKAALAKALDISSAYAGDLVNDKGKTRGGFYKPSAELTAKLAKVLQVSEVDIVSAAQIISHRQGQKKPQNVPEFIAALEDLGISIEFIQGEKLENATPDDLEELKEQIAANVGIKLKRIINR